MLIDQIQTGCNAMYVEEDVEDVKDDQIHLSPVMLEDVKDGKRTYRN